MPRRSINTEDSDDDWKDFLKEVEEEILEGPKKPDPVPAPEQGMTYPWFPFFPWPMPGDND
jgi:hypothetical protein